MRDRYLQSYRWKETDGADAIDLSRQLSSATGADSFKADRVQTPLKGLGLYARRPVRCVLPQLTGRLRLACGVESMHCGHRNSGSGGMFLPRRVQVWGFVPDFAGLLMRALVNPLPKRTPFEPYRYGGAGWLVWGGRIFCSRN
ncbi:hypothetical protein AVEN_75332-1 [Araneus ventricosus]|uniref:Uncharacterized protein n=1 Tax=Araneus ventricosus TaxID=182803 RepID=A0A4Y2W454_ARAVE|nr:hypothetical protein AVEN_75332-1 [Araneus ventricosus]